MDGTMSRGSLCDDEDIDSHRHAEIAAWSTPSNLSSLDVTSAVYETDDRSTVEVPALWRSNSIPIQSLPVSAGPSKITSSIPFLENEVLEEPPESIPLTSISQRTSSDTTKGDLHSNKKRMGDRILEDMENNLIDCPICLECVEANAEMWHCRSCFKVFHFHCMEDGVRAILTRRRSYWRCPSCKAEDSSPQPIPTCWCGLHPTADLPHMAPSTSRNSCGHVCNRTIPCLNCQGLRIRCTDRCHPGPCEVFCSRHCLSLAEIEGSYDRRALQVARKEGQRREMDRSEARRRAFSGSFEGRRNRTVYRTGARTDSGPNGRGAETEGPCSGTPWIFLSLNAAFMLWAAFHNLFQTQPYDYHTIDKRHENTIAISFAFFWTTSNFVYLFFSSEEGTVREVGDARVRCCPDRKSVGRWLWIAFWSIVPFVFMVFGPTEIWNWQMKDSCAGFDTRIAMDLNGKPPVPRMNFFLHTPYDSPPPDGVNSTSFQITMSKQGTNDTLHPFGDYYSFQSTLMIADLDLNYNQWRTSSYSSETQSMQPLHNGSFTELSEFSPHLLLPELNLQIPNMFLFTRDCYLESFLRVFRTDNLDEVAMEKQAQQKWGLDGTDDIVLRTASFGRGKHRLEVCARRGWYAPEQGWYPPGQAANEPIHKMEGLGDEGVMILTGLIAAMRKDMFDDDERDFCYDLGGLF